VSLKPIGTLESTLSILHFDLVFTECIAQEAVGSNDLVASR